MRRTLFIIISISISYLFNCYAHSTFDITKIPTEAKYLTAFGCLIICGIIYIVESEIISGLKNKIKNHE